MDNIDRWNLTYKFVKENQDYLWLKSRMLLGKNCSNDNSVLITGSSHALNGIDVHCFHHAINCSMHTQDIYYDFLCAQEIYKDSAPKFKVCFIVLGYYIAFQDLSQELRVGRNKIERIYYPLFQDSRNWENPVIYDLWSNMPKCNESEKEEIQSHALDMMMQREQYYSDMRIRRPLYKFGGAWKDLSDDEKDAFGQQRAADHNKICKHVASYEENLLVLKDYIHFLELEGVRPVFIIPPFTSVYNKYVLNETKDAVVDMVNGIGYKIDFIDYNGTTYFEDGDFVDTDHLNGRGAYKMSKLLAAEYRL